jgi:hypothetical protein
LKHELKKELVNLGSPAHTLHNCVQHRTDTLFVVIERIIMKTYNYLSTHTVRIECLKSFCEFVDINYRQYFSHSRTRWHGMITADAPYREIIFSLPI